MLRDHFRKRDIEEGAKPFFRKKTGVPDGMFRKCESCGEILYEEDVKENQYCCSRCGYHFRITPAQRLHMITDRNSFEEWDEQLESVDPLTFPGYQEKLEQMRTQTGLRDGVITGRATIGGVETAIGVMSPDFLMGSMGCVVGERITRMVERATKQSLPVVLFSCSGGARMQEGIFSLMQMAKTSQALKRHDEAGLLYISVLTDPTMGGVTASFAMLGDIILAEPQALIGFAGPRVIRQTIGGRLPEGFQSAEFLQKHGFIDRIVKREQMRKTLKAVLRSSTDVFPEAPGGAVPYQSTSEFGKAQSQENQKPSAWDRVLLARSANRPHTSDYISELFDGFLELRGDRLSGDDRAVIGGLARFDGRYVMVIGQQKGRNAKENRHRNFGMMNPEGYRKTLRLMKLAEKLKKPVLLFVDTPGAFCGVEAEERGQGEAIARNLFELSALKVPVLSVVIGEGGSGGALALALSNEVWMLENSVYSVLSPEGFAAILWKDGKRAPEAADCMRMTAAELKALGIIERVILEETPADRDQMSELTRSMKKEIQSFLNEYCAKTPQEITKQRYERFRAIGSLQEI